MKIYESCSKSDADISTMKQMDLPPEFCSFYAEQSKILGISDINNNIQEVQQQMLKALWESK